jgi:hypothetical protein
MQQGALESDGTSYLPQSHYSFRLKDKDGEVVHAYVEKGQPLAQQLVDTLKDGGCWMTVELQLIGRSSRHLALNRVVE